MFEVHSRQFEEQPTLVMITKVPEKMISDFIGKAFHTVAGYIGRSEVDFAGPPFARLRALDERFSQFEVEAGFPIDRALEGEGEVLASNLPSGPVATVTYMGPYDQMKPAYDSIYRWIEEQGGKPDGAPWEIFFSDPTEQPDPSTWRTDIVQPYHI